MVLPIRLTLVLATLLGLAMLTACGDSTPIIIGYSGQLKGKMADLGVYGRNGATLAVEKINSQGGIDGRPLEILAEDDDNTPEGAVKADTTLLEAGAVAIIGHMTSSQTMAAIPTVTEYGGLLISPTSSTPELTNKKDAFFRTMMDNTNQSGELAEYVYSALDINSVVIVADVDNKSYTSTYSKGFTNIFTGLGGKILDTLSYSSSKETNWDALATKIKQLNPDALLIVSPAHDAVALAQHVNTSHTNIRLISGAWAYTDELIKWGGEYVEGMIFGIDYAADNPNPEFIKFRESYRHRFGVMPNFAAAFSYEAVLVLAEALKKTGGSRDGLADALAPSETINGVIGPFKLNEYGDVKRNVFIVTVQDGGYRTVEMR